MRTREGGVGGGKTIRKTNIKQFEPICFCHFHEKQKQIKTIHAYLFLSFEYLILLSR